MALSVGRSRRRLPSLVIGGALAAATAVLVAVTIAAMASGDRRDDSLIATQTHIGGEGVAPLADFPPRLLPATAVVGDRTFVFGGQDPNTPLDAPVQLRNDAVLVNTERGEQVSLEDAPFDPPLNGPAAAAVGDAIVVMGERCKATRPPESSEDFCEPGTLAAAAFDVAKLEWSTTSLPERLANVRQPLAKALGATSDGRAVFEVRDEQASKHYWTYSPGDDNWAQLPAPIVRSETACLSGDQLFVLTAGPGEELRGSPSDGSVAPSLAILDLSADSAGWSPTPPPTEVKYAVTPEIACLNGAVMVLDPVFPALNMRMFDAASGTWSTPPNGPSRTFFRDRVWTGKELIFLPTEIDPGESGVAYDPSTGTWRLVPGLPPVTRGALWDGKAIVGYAEPLFAEQSLAEPGADGGPAQRFQAGVFRYPLAADAPVTPPTSSPPVRAADEHGL